VAGQGAAIQNQLNYSRDFEREADRVGLGLLERSGFDIRGMSGFFERMQKFGRLYENNAPGYLRTHPLTTERLADMGNRIQAALQAGAGFARIPAGAGQAARPGGHAARRRDRVRIPARASAISPAPKRPCATAWPRPMLRDGNPAAAEREMAELRRLKAQSPMIETLAAQVRLKQGDAAAR
jgi:predicted Zn-dependent protease